MNFKDKINSSEGEINFVEKRQIDRIRQGISDRENEDERYGDSETRNVRNRKIIYT